MSSDEYVPHSHIPYGADGSGFYTDNTLGCFRVIEEATPTVLKAIGDIAFKSENRTPFTVCDMGTADGGMSMYMMKDLIVRVRQVHGDSTELLIIYEDQPVNDFKSLFLRMHGLIPGSVSFLKEHRGVYVSAVGTGFFDQCCPSSTVHLAFSSTAMHWLSTRPCSLTGALHHTMSTVEDEKNKFAKQAAQDWETILVHRANELRPGGEFVLTCFCVDEEGQYLGNTKQVKNSMYERKTSIWKQMMQEGKITQEEFQQTTFNSYYRSKSDFTAPFDDPNSPVYKAGLRLVSLETKVVPCYYRAKWLKEGKSGDKESARAHAAWFIPTTRTWSNSTYLSALSTQRTQEERKSLVDELFQRYQDEVATDPSAHGMDYVHAYIRMQKQI